MEETLKLHIIDQGDPSVGIFQQAFSVECPMNWTHSDIEERDWFREKILKIYNEYSEGKLIAIYSDESYD